MQPRSKKRKQRAVVDTNVVVAGISGFREQYSRGRIASADLLHRWAVEENFLWLKDDAFRLCAEAGGADFLFTLNPRDFPQSRLKAKVIQPGHILDHRRR